MHGSLTATEPVFAPHRPRRTFTERPGSSVTVSPRLSVTLLRGRRAPEPEVLHAVECHHPDVPAPGVRRGRAAPALPDAGAVRPLRDQPPRRLRVAGAVPRAGACRAGGPEPP